MAKSDKGMKKVDSVSGGGERLAPIAVKKLQRGETQDVPVFRARRKEVEPEALRAALLGPVQSLLKSVCRWGARLGDGWDIGDYRFLIFEFRSGDALLYVQFWSEPGESVLMEVSSGRANPPAHHLVGAVQRKKLRELGFRMGGAAKNYEKDVATGLQQFRVLAEETVHILVDVLGYRGLTMLKAQLHADTRAEIVAVHSSVTPQELDKLLCASHFDVGPLRGDESEPYMAVRHREGELEVHLTHRVRGQNLFRQVVVTTPGSGQRLGVLNLDGGVTTDFLRRRLVDLIEYPLGDADALPHADETRH